QKQSFSLTPQTLDEAMQYYAPAARPAVLQALEQSLASGAPFTLECAMIARSGRAFWAELRCSGRIEIDGETFLTGTFQDISERKAAEAVLLETRQRLEDIFAFLPDATFVIDREGRVIAWNKALEKLTGAAATAMLGRGDYAYALPFYGKPRPMLVDLVLQEMPPDQRYYAHYSLEDGTIHAEAELALGGRNRVVLSGTAAALYDSHGQIVGAIEQIRDVTAWRVAEEAQRTSESRYRTVVAALSEGVVVFDQDGRVLSANPAAGKILGVAPADIVGWNEGQLLGLGAFNDSQTPIGDDELPIRATLRGGLPQRDRVIGFRRGDGPTLWLSINTEPVFTPPCRQPRSGAPAPGQLPLHRCRAFALVSGLEQTQNYRPGGQSNRPRSDQTNTSLGKKRGHAYDTDDR
ncbi:MAG TPA: PAS domain S-box protein, partial [Candidatus Obscuribacter sp.]|nr:PAS domain S-box protein [Candidatus Obscuribacter sp.]